jgi:heavy metal sensor kinase
MRSIRSTVLLYFLLLLSAALLAFSYLIYESVRGRMTLVYESTRAILVEERDRARKLREEQYEQTRQTLHNNFDAALLLRAQTMASQLADSAIRPERVFGVRPMIPLSGLVLAQHGPAVPLYFASYLDTELRHGWSSPYWTGRRQLDLAWADEVLHRSKADDSPAVYQVYNEQGEIMARSRALGEEDLPLPPAAHNLELCQPRFDDVVLSSGRELRCVTLKVPITRLSVVRLFPLFGQAGPGAGSGGEGMPAAGNRPFGRPGRRQETGAGPGGGSPAAKTPAAEAGPLFPPPPLGPPASFRVQTTLIPLDPDAIRQGNVPKVYLLYAKPMTEIQATLAHLREELDASQKELEEDQARTLEELQQDARLALAHLRTRLLLISGGVLVASVVGGFWVVRRSLSPLQRLKTAVSNVSERDFQLRIRPEDVPWELKPVVERLQQALGTLEKAFAREKQAAADISHDLRTPIASLLATTQVCLRRSRSPEEYRAALETCHQVGLQLNKLVERLLALARLDAGVAQANKELVDLQDLAQECLRLVKPLADQKAVSLHLEYHGPLLLETDADKLREVLTNLLDNAIEYNRPSGQVRLALYRDNGEVEIAVSDTGIGIPPETRTQIFERFYRADPSRHGDAVHCGLGLAIVKGYVDLLGGRIEVDSQAGKGSTFRVRFPAARQTREDGDNETGQGRDP